MPAGRRGSRRAAIRPVSPNTCISVRRIEWSCQTGACAQPLGRTPKADHMPETVCRRRWPACASGADQRAWHNDGVAAACRALLARRPRHRTADAAPACRREQPGHHRHREPAERGHRQRRQDDGFQPDRPSSRSAEPAGDQLGVAARDRNQPVGADVPGDDRKMRAGPAAARSSSIDGQGIDRLSRRTGRRSRRRRRAAASKPAHIADRETSVAACIASSK